MSNIIFESQFYSLAGEDYRVRLYVENYVGLNAPIIGGSGSVFYLAYNWSDYLQNNQPLTFGDTNISAAYKARVLANGGIFENEDCLKEFLDETDTVVSFTYNVSEDRTEITLADAVYSDQTVLKNDVTDAASFIPSLKPVVVDLVTEYKNSDDYILSPLMTSSTDITYSNVQEDRTSVETAFFDRFIDLYLQSDDDELRVTVERNVNGYKLQWAGNLVMDLIEWNNESSPREYVFRAIDGIDRLKDIEYNGDVASLQNKKLKDIVLDVLELNGLDRFWESNDVYLKESIEYKAIDVTGVNSSDSPLDYTYMYENLLMKKSKAKNDRVFLSGYDILYGIMEMMSTRLIHTNGYYYLQQLRNYDTINIINRDYLKNGTYSQGPYLHSNNTLRPLSGGTFGYLYGIKQARIESENKQLINIGQLPPKEMHAVNFVSSGASELLEILPVISQNVGDIKGGLASGQFINIQFDINSVTGLNFDADIVVRLYVYESSGNKFLKGSSRISPYWENAAVATEKYYEKNLVIRGNNNVGKERVTMSTPIIPYEMSSVIIALELVMTNIRKSPSNGTLVFFLEDTVVAVPEDIENVIESISANNPNTKFTKDLQLNNLMINEGNSNVQINNLTVDKNYNGGAFDLGIDSLWDGSFPLNGNLSSLRIMEAVSLQYKPLQKYMGDFEGVYYPYQTIPYNNVVFAASQLTINYLANEISGEWFEVLISRVGLSSSTIGGGITVGQDEVENQLRKSRELERGVGILDSDILPNTGILSIDINSQGDIKIGDKIQILSETGDLFLEITSSQDLNNTGAGATLAVESFDLDIVIPSGSRIVYGYKQMYFSEKIRFDTLQTTFATTAPTTLEDMRHGEIRFIGRNIYVRDGELLYRHHGSQYNP